MHPIRMWHGDHMRFRRLLDFLEEQTAAFHAGEQPDYELMSEVVACLHQYGNRYHHPREDEAFRRLAKSDPRLELQVEHLLREHHAIDIAGGELLGYLDEILEDAIIERATVEAAAARYIGHFRRHLDFEESEVLPRAEQILTPDDWAAVAAIETEAPDALLGVYVAVRCRDLRERVAREVAAPLQ